MKSLCQVLSLLLLVASVTVLPSHARDLEKASARDRQVLEGIIIPSVQFEGIPLQDAIDFVASKAIVLDDEHKGISIRWIREADLTQTQTGNTNTNSTSDAEPDRGPPINYIAHDVSVLTILQELAKQAHCDLHLTTIGVFLTPAGKLPSAHPKYPGARIRETLYRYEAGEN